MKDFVFPCQAFLYFTVYKLLLFLSFFAAVAETAGTEFIYKRSDFFVSTRVM